MQQRLTRLSSDYLWLAVGISVLVHAALFYYVWPVFSKNAPLVVEPDIVLINFKNDESILEALLLAQWQAAGGGEGTTAEAVSAPFSAQRLVGPNDLVLQAMRERLRTLESNQQARLQQLESEWQTLQSNRPKEIADEHNEQVEPNERTSQVARELHVLKTQISHYNAKPRIHFDAPSTQASPFAAYIENWRASIERLGTQHYPDTAKGQLSDSLQLTVYIDKEGHLLKVDIHQPAANPLFNVAAQRIVRLAAPFGPFNDQMREHTDVLAITRSWHFTQGNLTTD